MRDALIDVFYVEAPRKPRKRRVHFALDRNGTRHEIARAAPGQWEVNVGPGHEAEFPTLREAKAWIQTTNTWDASVVTK